MPLEVRFILKMSKQNLEHLYKNYLIQKKKSQDRLFQLSPHPHLKGWADFLLGKINKTPHFLEEKKKKKVKKIVIGRTSLGSKGVGGGAPVPCLTRLSIHVVWHGDISAPVMGPPLNALGGYSKKRISDEVNYHWLIITWEAASRGKQLWEEPDGYPFTGRFAEIRRPKSLPCLG